MPRPKKEGAPEPKKRSRNGCWPCKARKVKCGEEKPQCLNCKRQGETCDYSIRLNWGGRTKKKPEDAIRSSTTESETTFLSTTFAVAPASSGPPPQFAHSQYSFIPPKQHERTRSTASNSSIHNVATLVQDVSGADVAVSPTDSQSSSGQSVGAIVSPNLDRHNSDPFASARPGAVSLVDPRLHGARHRKSFGEYPSPPISSEGGPNNSNTGSSELPNLPLKTMPPPRRSNTMPESSYLYEAVDIEEHRSKRLRLSPPIEEQSQEAMFETFHNGDTFQSYPVSFQNYSPFSSDAITPSSSISDEGARPRTSAPIAYSTQSARDVQRVSIHSLLSTPMSADRPDINSMLPKTADQYTLYGYDVGLPDLDLRLNDDEKAIEKFSPPASYVGLAAYDSISSVPFHPIEREMAFDTGGYYAKPVPIKINKRLEPLPDKLLANPMNLLYFHHFLNHTARILVTHNCEHNPFRNVLPYLAVQDEHVLDLLLAFSAAHRARLLCHAEPTDRIAHWVQDVFPTLRRALDNSSDPSSISDSTLTTAIMLCSLEIISPNVFEVDIPWQHHLQLARQMIIARGGPQSIQRHDRVAYFLSRWFAYLDVLGSLSGSKTDRPLSSTYWVTDPNDPHGDDEWTIDCVLGFTAHCVGLLARIAELAKTVEKERFHPNSGEEMPGWKPSPAVLSAATKIQKELATGREVRYKGCPHRPSVGYTDASREAHELGFDTSELIATNGMFHSAALIHLLRRVMGRSSDDPEVQNAVRQVVAGLAKVRKGSTAEACLLFPMFTAGCEALETEVRERVMERVRDVEGFGMIHVQRARSLMQRVWESGRAWETLIDGEFFG